MYRNHVEEHRHAEAALRVLSFASETLAESLDYEQVVARLGALLVPELADWCLVDVVEGRELRRAGEEHSDPHELRLVEELHRRSPMDLSSADPRCQVLRTLEPIFVVTVDDEFMRALAPDGESLRLLRALTPRSAIVVPMVASGRNIGVLSLVRSQVDARYNEMDLLLVEDLARRAATALDNARLHRELRKEVQLRTERDRYLWTVFRQAPGTIWATDRHLCLTYAVGNMRNAPGLLAADLLGTTVYDFVGTRDPTEPVIANHLAVLAGERREFAYRMFERWYKVVIEPLLDEKDQIVGCVGAAFDVTEQRAAVESSARNEVLLAEAQRAAHVGSFEWDIKPNIVTWTDELHRIYGLEPGQFEGSFEAFLARVHPEDLERTKNVIFQAFRQRQPFVYEHRILQPNGTTRILHTRGAVITDADGDAVRILGTCWDVTELSEATHARERLLSLLQATLEATDDGILVVDGSRGVTLFNQRLQSLWNLSLAPDKPTSEDTVMDAMRAQVEDPDGFRASVLEVEAREHSESIDVIRLTDGRVFERHSCPQRVGDEVVGRVWSYRDISERESLLHRAMFLADATRLLASLDLEIALDAVARLVVPFLGDGFAVDLFGSGAPRRLLAVSRDPGKPISPQVHPSVLAEHATIYRVDSTSYLGVPLISKEGIMGAMTLAAAPHRKYTESDLEFAEELARRTALSIENSLLYQAAQEAVRGRDEFLSIASHEIRGPITTLHLAVQMLRSGKVSPESQPRTFDIIEREDRRLSEFLDELLELGRIRTRTLRFEYEDVDFGDIVRNVVSKKSGDLAQAGSSLSMTIDGQVRGAWDRLRLEQIVTNLLSNAIKFGLGKPIRISLSSRGGRAMLVVQDHGMGISPEAQQRIFEPFERAVSVRHYGGLGLGLYIVKTIVNGLGGCLRLQSTLSAGATFTVELPQTRTSDERYAPDPDCR